MSPKQWSLDFALPRIFSKNRVKWLTVLARTQTPRGALTASSLAHAHFQWLMGLKLVEGLLWPFDIKLHSTKRYILEGKWLHYFCELEDEVACEFGCHSGHAQCIPWHNLSPVVDSNWFKAWTEHAQMAQTRSQITQNLTNSILARWNCLAFSYKIWAT